MRFFEDLYKRVEGVRPKHDGLLFPSITMDTRCWLEGEFEDDEIRKDLEECGGDKAPGLDGINFSFIKAGWEFLKEDFGSFHSEIHQRGRINEELNASFFTLIPKVPNPVELKDYRPISLVGYLYKYLAKILANRLKSVLPNINSPFQGAFAAGGQILDGVLIANELTNSRDKTRKKG